MYDITKDLGDIQVTGLISNGAVTITGNTDITGNVNLLTQSEVRFQDTSGGEYIGLKANGTVASSTTFVLPTADGTSGQALKTDGSGNLSFGNVATDLTNVASNIVASVTDTYDLGTANVVWRNIYTGDLHLNNEHKTEGNSIDGTKGSWTLQEGKNDIYMINNISGEKFKIKMEKV